VLVDHGLAYPYCKVDFLDKIKKNSFNEKLSFDYLKDLHNKQDELYHDLEYRDHLPQIETHLSIGNPVFSSIASQEGLSLSRKDDIQCLFYLLAFLSDG
jgi:hypothetical protein